MTNLSFGETEKNLLRLLFAAASSKAWKPSQDCLFTFSRDPLTITVKTDKSETLCNALWDYLANPDSSTVKACNNTEERRAAYFPHSENEFTNTWQSVKRNLREYFFHSNDICNFVDRTYKKSGEDLIFTAKVNVVDAAQLAEEIIKQIYKQKQRRKRHKLAEATNPKNSVTITTPHNIPRTGLQDDQFVGRGGKLSELDQALSVEGSQTAIVAGGGIGKTELSIQYLNRFQHKFPGGICWVYARRIDSRFEVRQEHVELEIIRFARNVFKLEFPPGIVDLTDRLDHVFREWKDGKTLLVFDDLESEKDYEKIEPCIPRDRRFSTLITSRLKIGSPFRIIDLDVLTPEDSLELLESFIAEDRVRAEYDDALELVKTLEYLPLALELVARHLRLDPYRKIADVLQSLEDSKRVNSIDTFNDFQREKGVGKMTASRGFIQAIDLSWNTLSTDTKRVACAISFLCSSSFSWKQAEERITKGEKTKDLSSSAIRIAKDELLYNCLIKPTSSSDTYRTHSLTADYLLYKKKELIS